MMFLGLDIPVKRLPELDEAFLPMELFNRAFLRGARKEIGIAIERSEGQLASVKTRIYGDAAHYEADCFYIDRLVKTQLWMKGGYKLLVQGDQGIYDYLVKAYSREGKQAFDWDYMAKVYERPFEVLQVDTLPEPKDCPKAIGGHLEGCRIGFDAGGSDRKVSAVIDGETVYSEEVVWFPKTASDPMYHYEGIVAALRSAAAHLPRVDAVGVSSAGVYINNRTMNASLFLSVSKEDFDKACKDIYIRAITDTFGAVPFCVVNDGDVTALAGAMSLKSSNVLGIAMGTSEAGGYVDAQGRITGWLNELAFIPVDANPLAMVDEWSGDIGCGVKYFSQDAVIKLAPRAGLSLPDHLPPAEKLKLVQQRMEEGDGRAAAIYRSIGVYLAHSLAYYHALYQCEQVLLLGRVMSGKGGELLLDTCRAVLEEEYPELADRLALALPDETFRRVGQSAVAASLPEVRR